MLMLAADLLRSTDQGRHSILERCMKFSIRILGTNMGWIFGITGRVLIMQGTS